MSSEQDEAWEHIQSFVYAKDAEECNKRYTEYANVYEKDYKLLKSNSYAEMVEIAMQYFSNENNTLLLDAGAGTGLCGEVLLQCGYKGKMDALDTNAAMLTIARGKSIYRNHMEYKLTPNESLPVDEKTYDALICSGAFIPNHVDPECLVPMMKVLKPGGICAFNTRITTQNYDYRKKLEKVVHDLITAGQAEKVVVKEIVAYHSDAPDTDGIMKSMLYIYKRPA